MSRQQVRRMGFGAMGLGVLVLCLLVWGLVWAEDVKINTIGEKPADGSGVQAAGEGGDASAADKPNVNAPAKEFDAAAVAAVILPTISA